MPARRPKQKRGDFAAIIDAVKTPLAFFALALLVVEGALGVVLARTDGENQRIALYGMLFVLLGVIAAVCFFSYKKPEALLRTISAATSPEAEARQDFGSQIKGYWWEHITADGPSALSFVEIRPDLATGAVKLDGRAYTKEGELAATWESVASCINAGERKVFYYWKGVHPPHIKKGRFEGFGEITFREFSGQIDGGDGAFSDTNMSDTTSTTLKYVEFRRCSDGEAQTMQGDDEPAKLDLVRKRLSRRKAAQAA